MICSFLSVMWSYYITFKHNKFFKINSKVIGLSSYFSLYVIDGTRCFYLQQRTLLDIAKETITKTLKQAHKFFIASFI